MERIAQAREAFHRSCAAWMWWLRFGFAVEARDGFDFDLDVEVATAIAMVWWEANVAETGIANLHPKV